MTVAEPPRRKTPCNPEVEVASSRAQIRLSLPNLAMELRVRPRSCHATAEEHTFSLYSRSCKFQSTKAPSAAKSSNRTPGETLQRNTPFATIVEFASSTVQKRAGGGCCCSYVAQNESYSCSCTEPFILYELHSGKSYHPLDYGLVALAKPCTYKINLY